MPNPPVPLERKRARGNPGKRALPAHAETTALAPLTTADAPADLGPGGREAWERMMTSCPWLGESDTSTLRLLCEKIDRRDQMIEALKTEPFVFTAEKTGYQYANPLVGMLSTIETDIVKLLSLMGMTPTDRTRLGLAEVKAQSTLERLRSQRESRG
jgi:P27 family predicted phage terminase small subunit